MAHYQRNGKEYLSIPLLPKHKRILELRKKRTGYDFGDQLRPHIHALVEDTERLFGHLPEFKRINEERE